MSKDARNSLIAWGLVLGLAGFFWLTRPYVAMLPDFPPWLDRVFFALLLIGLVWDIIRSVRARAREKAGG